MTMTSLSEKSKEAQACENLLMKRTEKSESIRSFSVETDEEEEGTRHTWGKKTEYILAAIGYCVGLGNIWRFPYVCMRNGGGAFLIPFFLSLLICALPIYFLETAMGQFMGQGSWHVWSICPLFKGIGASMNLVTFLMTWYYSIILGWALIYMVNSFRAPLPWTRCDGYWNSDNCVDLEGNFDKMRSDISDNSNSSFLDGTLGSTVNSTLNSINETLAANSTSANGTISSTEEFWVRNVLQRSSGLDEVGGLPWHTSVALIVANVVVLIGVIKGIRSTGKVVYITATLPYLLLTVMIILGITLPGSMDGVVFYLKPDFRKLLDGQTWVDAFIQVFYSLGPGWGGLITMGSYNKFRNNCMRDSIFLTLACEGTSIYGGFAIFTILGHMSHISGIPIAKFARSGAGLAFIVYPTAIAYLPLPQLWGVLFFLMLFTLGLDTQFTCVETMLTTIADMWPIFVSKWRKSISIGSMIFFTMVGMIFATRGGIYLFTLVDWYIGAFSLMTQSVLECIIIVYIYGADRFSRDIELMIGRKPHKVFIWSWKYVAPVILATVQVITLITFKPPTYDSYVFSHAAEIAGWLIAVAPFSCIVVIGISVLMRQEGSVFERFRSACKPGPTWGPADPILKEKYRYNMNDNDNREKECGLCCSPV